MNTDNNNAELELEQDKEESVDLLAAIIKAMSDEIVQLRAYRDELIQERDEATRKLNELREWAGYPEG